MRSGTPRLKGKARGAIVGGTQGRRGTVSLSRSAMMLSLVLVVLPAIAVAGRTQGGPATPERQWVVRDVVLPEPLTQPGRFSWESGLPCGDLTRDGMADFLAQGRNRSGWSGTDIWKLLPSAGGDGMYGPSLTWSRLKQAELTLGPWWAPKVAMVGTPAGLELVGLLGLFQLPTYWALPSLVIEGQVPPPPPLGGGIPQMRAFSGIWLAGDLDSDGFDDLFYQSTDYGRQYFGMIDSRTKQVLWQIASPPDVEVDNPVTPPPVDGWPDLDGDGIPDYVAQYTAFIVRGQLPFEYPTMALSGVDGSILWSVRILGNSWSKYTTFGPDIDGDSLPDLVGIEETPGEHATCLSSADGSILWHVDNTWIDNLIPPTATSYRYWSPILATGIPGNPGEKDICVVVEVYDQDPVTGGPYDWLAVVHISPYNGQLVSFERLPDTLEPWDDDPVNVWTGRDPYNDHFLLGDIDRDGFTEIGRTVIAPDYSKWDGNNWRWVAHFVVLGQRTLFHADRMPVGSVQPLTVSIPSSPGRSFYILASDRFQADGMRLGGWNTHLGDSLLYRRTLHARPVTGVLDAYGEATVSWSIPGKNSLAGTKLYMRAVVLDPTMPGQVYTMSSLGVAEITR